MSDWWNASVPMTASQARMAVAKWIEIKMAQDNLDTRMYREVMGNKYDGVVMQLKNDAMHSGLLGKLLAGHEPDQR